MWIVGAHQRSLDDPAPLEPPRQRIALESLDPRPEADVTGGRVLRLEAADPLDRALDRRSRALEQELAREKRPVQLIVRQDALGHFRDATDGAPLQAE
jgi:hypothetical protein